MSERSEQLAQDITIKLACHTLNVCDAFSCYTLFSTSKFTSSRGSPEKNRSLPPTAPATVPSGCRKYNVRYRAVLQCTVPYLGGVGRTGLVQLLSARLQQLHHALQPLLVWAIRVSKHILDGLVKKKQKKNSNQQQHKVEHTHEKSVSLPPSRRPKRKLRLSKTIILSHETQLYTYYPSQVGSSPLYDFHVDKVQKTCIIKTLPLPLSLASPCPKERLVYSKQLVATRASPARARLHRIIVEISTNPGTQRLYTCAGVLSPKCRCFCRNT